MSYVDGASNTQSKALTGGIVAILQAGLAIAIISGFAVKDYIKQPDTRIKGVFVPSAPRPTEPPPPDQKVEPNETVRNDTRLTTPLPNPTLKPVNPVEVPLDPGPPPTDFLGNDNVFVPPVGPTATPSPAPRFTPKAANPRGNYAQWITTDDYPTRELRAGQQGLVRFRLDLDARGKVTDCTIVQSSGFDGLDAAACKYASKRARFDPATDDAGKAVAGSWTSAVRWTIPND